MTLQGTVRKALLLLGVLIASIGLVWYLYLSVITPENAALFVEPMTLVIGSAVAGLLLGLKTNAEPETAHLTAPPCVVAIGILLGSSSVLIEKAYPGLVVHAVGVTITTFCALLLVYSTRLIKPSNNTSLFFTAAILGILLLYLVTGFLTVAGFSGAIGFIHESGSHGIPLSMFIVGIASYNLVLDFDFVEQGIQRGNPKQMEWVGAFGLMVSLIWLYVGLLHLLWQLLLSSKKTVDFDED